MIKPGEPWGRPTSAAADLEVAGGDADLAAAVAGSARRRSSASGPTRRRDLARAVGLGRRPIGRGVEVALDVLRSTTPAPSTTARRRAT